jgi:hypothetical protein
MSMNIEGGRLFLIVKYGTASMWKEIPPPLNSSWKCAVFSSGAWFALAGNGTLYTVDSGTNTSMEYGPTRGMKWKKIISDFPSMYALSEEGKIYLLHPHMSTHREKFQWSDFMVLNKHDVLLTTKDAELFVGTHAFGKWSIIPLQFAKSGNIWKLVGVLYGQNIIYAITDDGRLFTWDVNWPKNTVESMEEVQVPELSQILSFYHVGLGFCRFLGYKKESKERVIMEAIDFPHLKQTRILKIKNPVDLADSYCISDKGSGIILYDFNNNDETPLPPGFPQYVDTQGQWVVTTGILIFLNFFLVAFSFYFNIL